MQNQSPSTPQSSTNEALAEASPASLDELINRAPDLSDAEVDRIVAYLWESRDKFAKSESTPKPKKAPRQKGPILSADEILDALNF